MTPDGLPPIQTPANETPSQRADRLRQYREQHAAHFAHMPDVTVEVAMFGLRYVSEAALRAALAERHPGPLEFVYRC